MLEGNGKEIGILGYFWVCGTDRGSCQSKDFAKFLGIVTILFLGM